MSLKIIKKGSAKKVHPFFFTDGDGESTPKTPVWPEVPLADEFPPAPEPVSVAEAPAVAPPVDTAQLEQEAFDRGFAEGQGKLEDVARQQIEETMTRYANALAEIAGLKGVLRTQVEEEVVRLAVAVAKKIVYREIHLDATIIQTLVRIALDRVSGKSAVTVRLSPVDYEYMLARHDELTQMEGREIAFVPDNTITQGGCLIQTESGDIDARIEEEFAEVEGAFFKGIK